MSYEKERKIKLKKADGFKRKKGRDNTIIVAAIIFLCLPFVYTAVSMYNIATHGTLLFSKEIVDYAFKNKYYPFYLSAIDLIGDSMIPTFSTGDKILCDKGVMLGKEIYVNDFIVYETKRKGENALKRVVAVEGDHIRIDKDGLWRNGELIDEPYINEEQWVFVESKPIEEVIPEGYVYVLGDNRRKSADSRLSGPVDLDEQLICRYIQLLESEE